MIAILVVIVLSVSGVLADKSLPTENPKTQTASLEIRGPADRSACDQYQPVYRDLTVPYRQTTSTDAPVMTERRCDD